MGYRRDTVGDIVGYVCDCGAPYRSYSAWHLHNKRTHESDPQPAYSEPVTEAREPGKEESKVGISITVFVAGMVLLIVYFRQPIIEWLGISGDDSPGMVYSVKGSEIL